MDHNQCTNIDNYIDFNHFEMKIIDFTGWLRGRQVAGGKTRFSAI